MHGQEVGMSNMTQSTPLTALQNRFGIIDLSSELRVIDLHKVRAMKAGTLRSELSMYKRSDADLRMKRFLESQPIPCKPNLVIADFWVSPDTVEYNATAFTPTLTPDTVLNFWVGPAAGAKPGNWRLLRDFIRDVICAGDDVVFVYLTRFIAHMLQQPADKPGVMIVLLGGQGTGKGMFFKLLRSIWPKTTLLISDMEQVTGRFNDCLERNFVVCLDEAMFAGNRKAMDRLKSTVSESHVQIEQKFQPARTIESVHRFFASSNHDHFGHIERDDRRSVILRVSESRQQDTQYFGEISTAIQDPNKIAAMVYYLQRKDLSAFDVRRKPKTNEHLMQKLKSLQGFERFWFEVLLASHLTGADKSTGFSGDWVGPMFVPTSTLVDNYKEFNRQAQKHQTVQSTEVTAVVRRLCSSARPDRQICKQQGVATNSQRRGLQLPDIATARREFECAMGGSLTWA
jgi:hypothetical protein